MSGRRSWMWWSRDCDPIAALIFIVLIAAAGGYINSLTAPGPQVIYDSGPHRYWVFELTIHHRPWQKACIYFGDAGPPGPDGRTWDEKSSSEYLPTEEACLKRAERELQSAREQ